MFEIKRPTLLLDRVKCERNIDILVAKARLSNVVLRPHFKTHQSHEIGRWFRDRGVDRCTVSSLEMAEYFASDDWNNITVAFPLNHLEGDRINQLAAKVKLNLLVSVADVLPKLLNTLKNEVGIFIEIDTGYHRTGIDGHDQVSLEKVMDEIDSSRLVRFEGFLSHAGHTYKCKSKDEIEAVHKSEVDILLRLKREYHRRYPDLILSIGDTPSASVVDEFSEVDEIRAGNLVFYDLTQHKIGSCELNQIAVALACPVVATYPERNEIVTYGGGVHFSKDFLIAADGNPIYGVVVMLDKNGWRLPPTSMYLKSLSQEHGVIAAPGGVPPEIHPGSILAILPVHSCMTADAMGCYFTSEGTRIDRLI